MNGTINKVDMENKVSEQHKTNGETKRLHSLESFAAAGRIARTIAHEVRNPLTNISLASEQLLDEMPPNEELAVLIRMIDRNAARINQIITDLLNSTKFTELNFTNTFINTILDDALTLVSDHLQLKAVQVNKQYDEKMNAVNVDDEKMRTAFRNIITNAIEAMDDGKGLLTITTTASKDKYIVSIKDNGSGIPEEHMPRLFEPYFTSKMKNTGLGLTNTQNIIFNHKGNIYAESELGKGANFVVELNCA